jgi:hypothetical protein
MDHSTTGDAKYAGDCLMCGWATYEGLTHMCTTAPRQPWVTGNMPTREGTMEEYQLKIEDNGDVTAAFVPTEHERESRLAEIAAALGKPDFDAVDLSRKIAEEMAIVTRLMVRYANDVSIMEGIRIKVLSEEIKALKALSEQVLLAADLRYAAGK